MFKYGPRRNFKTKYARDINKEDNSSYTKMYNLQMESINANTLLKLQNRIGNRATQELLEQLSMTEITRNNSKQDEVKLTASDKMPYNNSNSANMEIDNNFKSIIDSYSNRSSDILRRNMQYNENRQNGRISLNSENIYFIIHKLDELSTMLKIKEFDVENKELEIKSSDKMLNSNEKVSVTDADYILEMICKLHKYNEDDTNIQDYMKVINLLSNTGINLVEFLSLNNNMNEQKKMLYKALGADKAAY